MRGGREGREVVGFVGVCVCVEGRGKGEGPVVLD